MGLENFFAKEIKELQKIVLANIVGCSDDIKKNALEQIKNVKFQALTEEQLAEKGENNTVVAFFSEDKNTIFFNSINMYMPYFKHILLHEMFHAYSFNSNKTGFHVQNAYNITVLNQEKNHTCSVFNNKYEMLNEAATEFYATIFSDKQLLSYGYFIPIYSTLCNVCGYDKLLNYYFSNNVDGLINDIKKTFHLKNDYLINKLFMQMDECYNLKTGETNVEMLPNVYKTLIDMFVKKLNYEWKKKLNRVELSRVINIDNIFNISNVVDNMSEKYNSIKEQLKYYLSNYKYSAEKNNLNNVKAVVDNFVCERLINPREMNKKFYKKYFYDNIRTVLLYLNQSNEFMIDGKFINQALPINEFLIFMRDQNKKISLSKLNNEDKKFFIDTIVTNRKHYIVDAKKHFYANDLKILDNLSR